MPSDVVMPQMGESIFEGTITKWFKKVGNAVKRNRARRRLRAAVDDVLRGSGASGADLVIVARQGTITRPYTDLKTDLTAALRRFGIVK